MPLFQQVPDLHQVRRLLVQSASMPDTLIAPGSLLAIRRQLPIFCAFRLAGTAGTLLGQRQQYGAGLPETADLALADLRARINADQHVNATTTVAKAWGPFQEHELYDPEIALQ